MSRRNKLIVAGCIVILGVALRLAAALYGSNYDFESYLIVADITEKGGNVYAETSRYNYGPVWFTVLFILRKLSYLFSDPVVAFRLLVPAVITLGDLAVSVFLYKKFSPLAAAIFFLNPVSILITGFHSQFDVLAIAAGMWALVVYEKGVTEQSRKKLLLGLLLLGFSLMIKHVLVFLPVWLFIREKTFARKGAALALPVLVLLLSLLPFMLTSWWDIRANVILYDSAENAPLLLYGLPPILSFVPLRVFMFGGLLLAGFLVRKRPLYEYVIIYELALVLSTMSVINHHLVIPMSAIAAWPNIFFGIYTLLVTYMLSLDKLGLKIEFLVTTAPDQLLFRGYGAKIFALPIFILFLGVLWKLRFRFRALMDSLQRQQ